MAANPANKVVSIGRSTGDKLTSALDEAGQAVTRSAARSVEEAEDMWAEARQTAGTDTGRDAMVYVGLAVTAAAGAIELPVAAAIGLGYAIARRR